MSNEFLKVVRKNYWEGFLLWSKSNVWFKYISINYINISSKIRVSGALKQISE